MIQWSVPRIHSSPTRPHLRLVTIRDSRCIVSIYLSLSQVRTPETGPRYFRHREPRSRSHSGTTSIQRRSTLRPMLAPKLRTWVGSSFTSRRIRLAWRRTKHDLSMQRSTMAPTCRYKTHKTHHTSELRRNSSSPITTTLIWYAVERRQTFRVNW